MKSSFAFLQRIFVFILFIAFIVSCKKSHTNGGGGTPGTEDTSLNSLSAHLQFLESTQKQGTAPEGADGSSLKISIRDTLELVEGVLFPIKFLQSDTLHQVAGAFIQVVGLTGGSFASSYYDVPEIQDDNDTISVVLVGFDPTGYNLPASFNIKVILYDDDKKPVGETIIPVKVEEHKADPNNPGACGLVLPAGEFWDWEFTIKAKSDFENFPRKIWNAEGQTIRGSCCAGFSSYPENCSGNVEPNASLHFDTYYTIMSEFLTFNSNGTYFRITEEDNPLPLPDSSDFCRGKVGAIEAHRSLVTYEGTYELTQATLPADLGMWKDNDKFKVSLKQTSQTPAIGGYGGGSGIIHQLTCNDLVLMQIDLEGFGQHLFTFYQRRNPLDPVWFSLK